MANFYVDDSVHDEAGFVLCACVCAPDDIEKQIVCLMMANGLDPDKFEYKSSANYSKSPELRDLRIKLRSLIHEHCRYGVVVLPRTDREKAGEQCLLAIAQFIDVNKINAPISVFMDQGLFSSKNAAFSSFKATGIGANFFPEQDSRLVRGIQLADLVAHTASVRLKCDMGLIDKMVKAGPDSGYDPDDEIELSFELFASLRYSIFNEGNSNPQTGDQFIDAVMQVGDAGLFISKFCLPELAAAAKATFGTVYLGCIH